MKRALNKLVFGPFLGIAEVPQSSAPVTTTGFNIGSLIAKLHGNKTYLLVAFALTYIAYCWKTHQPVDFTILAAFGFGGFATLKHGQTTTTREAVLAVVSTLLPPDQAQPDIAAPAQAKSPTVPPAATLAVLLLLGFGFVGCVSSNPERTALVSTQITLDTVDAGRTAYVSDLVRREKAALDASHNDIAVLARFAAEKQTYIDTVRTFQKASKTAIEAWAATHVGLQVNPTPEQLAEFDTAFAAARADLLALIAPYLKK